jgi:hypothetical protein
MEGDELMSRMDDALDEIYEGISHLYNYEEPDFEDTQLFQQKYRELMAEVRKLSEYSDGGHGRTCECFPCQQANYRMDRDDPSVGGYEE